MLARRLYAGAASIVGAHLLVVLATGSAVASLGIQASVAIACGLTCLLAMRRRGLAPHLLVLGAAPVAWGAGRAVLALTPTHSISISSFAFSAAFAALTMPGLLLLHVAAERRLRRLRIVLDSLLIAGSVSFIGWAAGYSGVFRTSRAAILETSLTSLIPLFDVVLVAAVVFIGVRSRGGSRRTKLARAGVGLAMLAGADAVRALVTMHGDFKFGTVLDVVWTAGFITMALSTFGPNVRDREARVSRPARLVTLLPYGAVIVAAFLAMAKQITLGSLDPFLQWNGIALVVFAMVRQSLTQIENLALRRELETQVESRTEQLVSSESRLRRIVEAAPVGMLICSSDGRIELINSELLKLTGYSREELIGAQAWILVPDHLRPALEQIVNADDFASAAQRVRRARREITVRRKDGVGQPVEVGLSRIETETGISFLATLTDVSMRHESVRLQKEKRVAEEATRAKSAFLANMSHEIRTPMNAVMGLSELLLRTDLDEEQHDYAQMIQASGEHLLTIIDDILEFSKIEAQDVRVESVAVDVGAVVDSVVELVSYSATKKGLALAARIDDEVPKLIAGDPRRLRQVLMNLLSNAIKFTDQGLVYVTATPRKSGDDDYICFSVRDSGIGIEQDRVADVFEEFAQLDSSLAREHEGTGLGLAICRRLVQAMGGNIWVESEVGVGSTFSFTIPAHSVAEDSVTAAQEGVSEAEPVERPSALRILLVEDNSLNRKVASAMLANCGYSTDIATNGKEALERLDEKVYDVVFMDVQMPLMDGLAATREIHRRYEPRRRPRIIGMTAHVLSSDIEACRAAGMDDYLAKPVSTEKIAGALAKVKPVGDNLQAV